MNKLQRLGLRNKPSVHSNANAGQPGQNHYAVYPMRYTLGLFKFLLSLSWHFFRVFLAR